MADPNNEIDPRIKSDINDLVEKKMDKFFSNVQKISLALGVLLGIVGWKSCDDIKSSIKNEIKIEWKKDIVNDKFNDEITEEVKKIELESILNIITSKIIYKNFSEEDIKDSYIELFSFFLKKNDEIQSLKILKNLNDIKDDKEYGSLDISFKNNLLPLANKMLVSTSDIDLKDECIRFIINYTPSNEISTIIDEIKNNNLNSPLLTRVDDYVMLITRKMKTDEPDKEDYDYQSNKINAFSEFLIKNYPKEDPILLSSYISLLALSDKKTHANYVKELSSFIDINRNDDYKNTISLLQILVKNDFLLNEDDGPSSESSNEERYSEMADVVKNSLYQVAIDTNRYNHEKGKQKRDAKLLVKKLAMLNEDFYSNVFNGLYDIAKTEQNKLSVFNFFVTPKRSRGNISISCMAKVKNADFSSEIVYDTRGKHLFYTDSTNTKKIITTNDISDLELLINKNNKISNSGSETYIKDGSY